MSNTALLGSYGAQDSSSLMFRNRIINGDMRIDQRLGGTTSATINSAANTYTLDRWFATGQPTDGVFTIAQSSIGLVGFTKALLATITTADLSIGLSQSYAIGQKIEGFNVADLAWGTSSAVSVTLSFRVYSSVAGTFGGSIMNEATNRSHPFTYTIPTINNWTTVSVTIPGDTTGTWATDNTSGMRLYFSLGAGSSAKGTAGTWAATAYYSATGTTDLIATNGATLYITGVQLEAGPVATPFERRPIGTELALCQRYFEKSYELEDKPGTDVNGLTPAKRGGLYYSVHSDGVSDSACQIFYKVTKRKSNNTLTFYTTSGSINQVFRSYSGGSQGITPGVSYNSANSVVVFADESIVPAWTNTVVEFCFTCDAEL